MFFFGGEGGLSWERNLKPGWEECVALDRALGLGRLNSNLSPTLLGCVTLDGWGPLWTSALSSWRCKSADLMLSKVPSAWTCRLRITVRYPSCCLPLLFHSSLEPSETKCQWVWLHRVVVRGAGRRLQIHFSLAFPVLLQFHSCLVYFLPLFLQSAYSFLL